MFNMLWKALALLALAHGLDAKPSLNPTVAQYSGQQVAYVLGVDSEALAELASSHIIDIMRGTDMKGKMTARVTPLQAAELKDLGFKVQVAVEDLAVHLTQLMAEEKPVLKYRHYDNPEDHFKRYYNYMQVGAYMDELVAINVTNGKQSWLKKKTIGKTLQKRPMWAVEVGNPAAPNAIFMEGGIHASEWVGHTSALYILMQMIEKFAHDEDVEMFDTYKFFFVPLMNVDGFRYSYLTDRLWRKNRRQNANESCMGVDLNRNYNGFNGWKLEADQCNWNYGGPSAYSEPETQVMVNYLDSIKRKHRVVAAFDMHSYDQSIVYPYGYDFNLTDAPNRPELVAAATAMSAAMKAVSGLEYEVKNAADWYPGYGCADDYWYDKVVRGPFTNQTGLVYTVEMRPKADDPIGFVLPANQILPAAKEMYAGFQAAMKYLGDFIKVGK